MKRMFLLLACSLLAATLAIAQDSTSSSASGVQDQNSQTKTQSSTTKANVIRGCLSGSTGNYTITDPNGMQYQISGDDATLRSMVGREVEVSVTEDRSSESTQSDSAAAHASNEVQVSDVKAVSTSCKNAPSAVAPNSKTPEAGERPSPQMMSMLQQQSAPGQGESQHGAAPPTANSQSVNNPATASPNAVPASPNPATPSANPQQSQANCNQSKPLYECPATDIPWAKPSSGSTQSPSH